MSETIKKTNKVITFSISDTLRNMQDFHNSFIIDWNSKSLYLLDILRYYDVMLCSVLALYSLFILLCLLSSAFAFFPSTFWLLKMTKKKQTIFTIVAPSSLITPGIMQYILFSSLTFLYNLSGSFELLQGHKLYGK